MSDTEWDVSPPPVPELLNDRDFRTRLDLFSTDWTTRTMRPETVLVALMQQAPGEPLVESVEELSPLHDAVVYAGQCVNAEDTYILNAINSEGITYDELSARLGVSRSQSWRLHQRAITRLRTLLLNHPPVRERLGMPPTWEAAAMHELVAIASYSEGFPDDAPPYAARDAAADIDHYISDAAEQMNLGLEQFAVNSLTGAARFAVAHLRSLGQWSLIDQHRLLCGKQNDYGHGNILKFGMTGVIVRCSDKAERLKNLTLTTGVAAKNESLLDSFRDVIGYAVIARMLKAETFELPLAEGEH